MGLNIVYSAFCLLTSVGFGLDGDGSLLGSTVPARRQRKSVTIIASPGPLGFDLTFPSHWEGDSGGPSYYGAIDFAEIAGVHSSGDSVARATDVAVTGAPMVNTAGGAEVTDPVPCPTTTWYCLPLSAGGVCRFV